MNNFWYNDNELDNQLVDYTTLLNNSLQEQYLKKLYEFVYKKEINDKNNRKYFNIDLQILCNLVQPLNELKNMVGMKNVKENIINHIIFFLQGFNNKDKCNSCVDCIYNLPCTKKNMNEDMLHTVITGP